VAEEDGGHGAVVFAVVWRRVGGVVSVS
jgi:hypothetical protein